MIFLLLFVFSSPYEFSFFPLLLVKELVGGEEGPWPQLTSGTSASPASHQLRLLPTPDYSHQISGYFKHRHTTSASPSTNWQLPMPTPPPPPPLTNQNPCPVTICYPPLVVLWRLCLFYLPPLSLLIFFLLFPPICLFFFFYYFTYCFFLSSFSYRRSRLA